MNCVCEWEKREREITWFITAEYRAYSSRIVWCSAHRVGVWVKIPYKTVMNHVIY